MIRRGADGTSQGLPFRHVLAVGSSKSSRSCLTMGRSSRSSSTEGSLSLDFEAALGCGGQATSRHAGLGRR